MTDLSTTAIVTQGASARESPNLKRVAVPKDTALGPLFAARKLPRGTTRSIRIGDKLFDIGGFHPLRKDVTDPSKLPAPLDYRHGILLIVLLSYLEPGEFSRDVSFSINDMARRFARRNGGSFSRSMIGLFADLIDTFWRITHLITGTSVSMRLIERIVIEDRMPRRKDAREANSKQTELFFHGITFSAEFFEILKRTDELRFVNVEALVSIRSPLASVIYMYMPSRAHHHTEDDPFEITVTNLLQQVSFPVPEQKSRRRQLFVQNRNSILSQLDGVETVKGILRVRLVETVDGLDWKLQFWEERYEIKLRRDPQNSKLMTQFLAAGHTQSELDLRLDNPKPLDYYEEEMLKLAEINVDKDRRFLELAKALAGQTRFRDIVSECKNDALEGRAPIKNTGARLVWRLMQAVSEKPASKLVGRTLSDGEQLNRLMAAK